MEEGPEPQELIERTVEHHHHEHEHGHEPAEKRRLMMVSAITAAVLAVLAAVGSLLSGHAANEAILAQSKANDQWGLYQAKSVKGHIYEGDRKMFLALAHLQDAGEEKTAAGLKSFEESVGKYEAEKKEIRGRAEGFEKESRYEFARHHWFALGIAAFQVGIVLASISIIVPQRHLTRALYGVSLGVGVLGIGLLLYGLLLPESATPREAQPEAVVQTTAHG